MGKFIHKYASGYTWVAVCQAQPGPKHGTDSWKKVTCKRCLKLRPKKKKNVQQTLTSPNGQKEGKNE